MKTTLSTLLGGLLSIFFLVSCQRDVNTLTGSRLPEPFQTEWNARKPTTGTTGTGVSPYTITLTGPIATGNNWQWTWAVQNNQPGNGNNGTVQDLSHWGFSPAACFNFATIVSAAYSTNGSTWTYFTPVIGIDPSSCVTTPVFKFNAGTSGNNKTYYRLVVNQNYPVGTATGYYKSGNRTGCGQFTFPGIACGTVTGGYSEPD